MDKRVHKDFLDLVMPEAGKVKFGDPFAADTTMGPMNNIPVFEKTERHFGRRRKSAARKSFLAASGCAGQTSDHYLRADGDR